MKKTKLSSYTQVNKRVFGYIVDRPSQATALRIFSRARYEEAVNSYHESREKVRVPAHSFRIF